MISNLLTKIGIYVLLGSLILVILPVYVIFCAIVGIGRYFNTRFIKSIGLVGAYIILCIAIRIYNVFPDTARSYNEEGYAKKFEDLTKEILKVRSRIVAEFNSL